MQDPQLVQFTGFRKKARSLKNSAFLWSGKIQGHPQNKKSCFFKISGNMIMYKQEENKNKKSPNISIWYYRNI